jgi:beta-phosphoglucomutase
VTPDTRSAGGVRAVVFDLDGTLSESMPQHYRAYLTVLEPYGLHPSFLDVCLLEGKRSAEVIEILAGRAGKPIAPEKAKELGDEKQRVFRSLGVPKLYPGARPLLESIRSRGMALGLTTGTNRANVRHMLGEAADLFGVVLGGEEVKKTKPDPEGYLRTFEALKVPPSAGVVVENAPLGIQAARAAGAPVIAVLHTLSPPYLWEASAVVENLDGVERWLLERVEA